MSVTTTDDSADAPGAAAGSGGFQDKLWWYTGTSAYWFAVSMKWFIVFLLQPIQVAGLVPGGDKNSAWGTVVSLGAAEAMIGPALFGYLSDRCGSRFGRRRPFIAIGAALTSLALLFLSGANTLPMMVFAYLLLQISDDVATGPYSSVVPDSVPTERRGQASGVINMTQLLAQIAAVAIAIPLQSIQKTYVAIAGVNIVFALITLLVYRERAVAAAALPAPADRKPVDFAERVRHGMDRWIAPFRSPDFRWVWIARFLGALGFYVILVYVSNYLSDRVPDLRLFGIKLAPDRKGEIQNAALVAALTISLAGALTSVWAGKLADRIGRKKVITVSGWLMFVTLVPFALIPNYSAVVVLAIGFGMGYGAYLSAMWALASDVLPRQEDAAKDMGIWQASISSPQIVAGMVGFLIDFGNRQRAGLGYSTAFLISAFVFLIGCLLVNKVRGSK